MSSFSIYRLLSGTSQCLSEKRIRKSSRRLPVKFAGNIANWLSDSKANPRLGRLSLRQTGGRMVPFKGVGAPAKNRPERRGTQRTGALVSLSFRRRPESTMVDLRLKGRATRSYNATVEPIPYL